MRNNNLIQRQKRHASACFRFLRESSKAIVSMPLALKALHHAQMQHLAWRARHEFKRRPRETR